MNALAVCLFALGLTLSLTVIVHAVRHHWSRIKAMRAQLASCPTTLSVTWQTIEHVTVPDLATLRRRASRRGAMRLEWTAAAIRSDCAA